MKGTLSLMLAAVIVPVVLVAGMVFTTDNSVEAEYNECVAFYVDHWEASNNLVTGNFQYDLAWLSKKVNINCID